MAWWKNAGDFLNLDKASNLLDKAKAAARDAAEQVEKQANKLSETVQEEYRKTFVELDCKVVYVRPQLAVMEFPSHDTINRLATRLNAAHKSQARIYNLSELPYDKSVFEAEVLDIPLMGLPIPPLEQLFDLCLNAHTWLQADSQNILVIHCNNYSSSSAFLCCFMLFRGLAGNSGDALKDICGCLDIDEGTLITPSQRRYIAYFQQCLNGYSPLPAKLCLKSAKLSSVPCFDDQESVAFRACMEVCSRGEVVYTSKTPQDFLAIDSCVALQLPEQVVASQDVFIKIYHVTAGGKRVLAMSFAFYAAFATSGLRLSKAELDSACSDSRFGSDVTFELVAEECGDEDASQAPEIFEKATVASKRFHEEQKRLQEAASREGRPDEDEELEKTLMRNGSPSRAVPSSAGAAPPEQTSDLQASELQKALAEAAAEEEKSAKEQVQATTQGTSSSGGYSTGVSAPIADGQNLSTAHDTLAATQDSSKTKASNDEIDDLFNQFDAALDAVGGGSSGTTASVAASTAASVPTAHPTTSDSSDPFADTDAFLKELDG